MGSRHRLLLLVLLGSVACAVDDRSVTTATEMSSPGVVEGGSPDGSAGSIPVSGAADPSGNSVDPSTASRDAGVAVPAQAPPAGGATTGVARLAVQSDPAHDLGAAEVGTDGGSVTWTIVNTGSAVSGELALSNDNPDAFRTDVRCPLTLDPGESCSILVTFTPHQPGPARTQLTFGNADAGLMVLALSAQGRFRVAVTITGAGRVEGLASPCVGACSALVDAGPLVLHARTNDGDNLLFAGWSRPECPGLGRDCTIDVESSVALAATFESFQNNLMFMSSELVAANLGGTAPYDARCNALATAAGVNSAAGNAFIALLSDSSHAFFDRLPSSARGWVGMDGLPIADQMRDLFAKQLMYYPVRFDELGGDAYLDGFTRFYWTGMLADGSAGANTDNCSDWSDATDANAFPLIGFGNRGPFSFSGVTTVATFGCTQPQNLICVGTTRSAALVLPRASGKRIWLTETPYVPGSSTPDAKCLAEAPQGVTAAAAFVTHLGVPAATVLGADTTYVRTDGLSVGTGAQLAAKSPLTGVWLTASGAVLARSVWAGQLDPTQIGSLAATCGDWATTTGTSPIGSSTGTDTTAWSFFASESACTATTVHLYCVER